MSCNNGIQLHPDMEGVSDGPLGKGGEVPDKNRCRALPGQCVEGKWVQQSGAGQGVGGRGCAPPAPLQAAALQGCAAAAVQPPPQQRDLTLLQSMYKHLGFAELQPTGQLKCLDDSIRLMYWLS